MRCQTCGVENPDQASFCQGCASPIRAQGQTGVPSSRGTQNKKSSSKTVVIIVVAVVLVIVILAIIASLAINAAVDDALTTDAEITVLSAAEVADPFWVPQSGYRFVELTVTMTNNEDTTLALSVFEFEIVTSDGTSYSATVLVENTLPSSILAGQTATFTIAFQVPEDKTPTKLVYHEVFGTNEVEATVGTVSPVVYKITVSNVSVDIVTEAVYPAQDGYEYVNVSLIMTNNYDDAISLYSFDFQLMTTEGLIYDCTWAVDDTIPDGLASGSTATFTMAFEIPVSATPDILIFDAGGFILETPI